MILLNNDPESFYSLDANGYVQEIMSFHNGDKWLNIIQNVIEVLNRAQNDNKILFLYRGENRETFGKKTGLSSNFDEDPHYDRFFVIGSKAKSYYKEKQKGYLTIKQFDHQSKASYIFDNLNKFSQSSRYHSVLSYFNNKTNENHFIEKLMKIKDKIHQITIENFYLAFIHTISSEPMSMKAHSVLLSSTKNADVAKSFSNNGFIIGFWLQQPITNQAINYASIDEINNILNKYSFPTIEVIHFPDESEVTIFSGIFPHNIYFVYDVCHNKHVFNPYLLKTDINEIIDKGINVDQKYFYKKIKGIYSNSIWRYNSELLYEK